MSAPKPPVSRASTAPSTPAGTKVAGSSSSSSRSSGGRLKASALPLVLGIVSVAAGAALLIPAISSAGSAGVLWIGLAGYFLAGFATPLLWGWDAASQRRGYMNPNFSGKRGYSSALRVLALLGIAVSIVHLFFVSTIVAEKISEWLFINEFVSV